MTTRNYVTFTALVLLFVAFAAPAAFAQEAQQELIRIPALSMGFGSSIEALGSYEGKTLNYRMQALASNQKGERIACSKMSRFVGAEFYLPVSVLDMSMEELKAANAACMTEIREAMASVSTPAEVYVSPVVPPTATAAASAASVSSQSAQAAAATAQAIETLQARVAQLELDKTALRLQKEEAEAKLAQRPPVTPTTSSETNPETQEKIRNLEDKVDQLTKELAKYNAANTWSAWMEKQLLALNIWVRDSRLVPNPDKEAAQLQARNRVANGGGFDSGDSKSTRIISVEATCEEVMKIESSAGLSQTMSHLRQDCQVVLAPTTDRQAFIRWNAMLILPIIVVVILAIAGVVYYWINNDNKPIKAKGKGYAPSAKELQKTARAVVNQDPLLDPRRKASMVDAIRQTLTSRPVSKGVAEGDPFGELEINPLGASGFWIRSSMLWLLEDAQRIICNAHPSLCTAALRPDCRQDADGKKYVWEFKLRVPQEETKPYVVQMEQMEEVA